MTQPVSAFLLAGSVRALSHTHALVAAIADRLAAETTVDVWDLRRRPLPIADPEYHHNPKCHPDAEVRAFVNLVEASSAIVLATPIYHNGVSGVLKNALDHLTIDQFFLKPVGLASHGGHRTTQAVEQLRVISRGLHAYAIVGQVCTSNEDYTAGSEGQSIALTAAPLLDRVDSFCRELLVMARVMPYARQMLG